MSDEPDFSRAELEGLVAGLLDLHQHATLDDGRIVCLECGLVRDGAHCRTLTGARAGAERAGAIAYAEHERAKEATDDRED